MPLKRRQKDPTSHHRLHRRLWSSSTVVLLTVLAFAASGCIVIRSQSTIQRAPGVVSLKVVVCAADRDRSTYATCDPEGPDRNTAEQDELAADADESAPSSGQLLLAFRVPDGSTGPGSFLSDAQDISFSRSPSYTDELTVEFPPPAGFHWEGYISTRKDFNPAIASSRETAATVEFTLPAGAGGAPFTGPLQWRPVASFRQVDAGEESAPVDCSGIGCVDTPRHDRVPVHLEAPVSDFGVLAGNAVQAAQGATATVSVPVEYTDAGGLGQRDLTITARTSIPGATATPDVTVLRAAPDSTSTVNVTVPVPAGTPLGAYTVTLTAATGSPAVERSNTATVQVVDRIDPVVSISSPASDANYLVGQNVAASYACTDELNGSGIKSCAGPVASGAPIDTSSPGTKSFTVNASDNAGNIATLTRTYTVVAPRILVTLTFNFSAKRKGTRFTALILKDAPQGSEVTVKCRSKKKGRKCPIKSFRRKTASGKQINIRSFLDKRFPVGTVIEARVTQPGKIGAVKRLKIRKRKSPKSKTLCLPPGANKPTKCDPSSATS